MLNFLPLRNASVSLLYGKRPIQRISVGGSGLQNNSSQNENPSHEVEIPLPIVDSLYSQIDESKMFHNNRFQPLQWKAFMQLKLDSYYLMEASQVGDAASKSALTDIDWYPKLNALYSGNQTIVELDAFSKFSKTKFTYPIQGKNI